MSAKKRQEWRKKRAARFADYSPPVTQPVVSYHRKSSMIHRGRITEAALRAIYAVTSEQL